jgi:hypothetical protein
VDARGEVTRVPDVPLRRRTVLGAVVLPLLTACESRPGRDRRAPATTPSDDSPRTDAATTPGGGDGDDDEPRIGSVTVVNDATADHFVTVAVESRRETHLLESRTVRGGTAVGFDGVVPSTGVYRVVVDTDTEAGG